MIELIFAVIFVPILLVLCYSISKEDIDSIK